MMEVENNVAEHFEGDCAVNGVYEDLPDELNQSKDNGELPAAFSRPLKVLTAVLGQTSDQLSSCHQV
jgi:hypothetical protein